MPVWRVSGIKFSINFISFYFYANVKDILDRKPELLDSEIYFLVKQLACSLNTSVMYCIWQNPNKNSTSVLRSFCPPTACNCSLYLWLVCGLNTIFFLCVAVLKGLSHELLSLALNAMVG
jgi:hypothetical protein